MNFLKNGQKGQGVVEYLLIFTLVSVVTAVILALIPTWVWGSVYGAGVIGIGIVFFILCFFIFRGPSRLPTSYTPSTYNNGYGGNISWWEYLLILILVGVVVLVILTLIGPAISNLASPFIKISP